MLSFLNLQCIGGQNPTKVGANACKTNGCECHDEVETGVVTFGHIGEVSTDGVSIDQINGSIGVDGTNNMFVRHSLVLRQGVVLLMSNSVVRMLRRHDGEMLEEVV
jgi:hypothetical protein